MNETPSIRDLHYQTQHDAIYASLDLLPNWMVFGHLSLNDTAKKSEKDRLRKFHLLIRDLAGRFVGVRDLDAFGWFLREEGNWQDKRFHFHFSITSDNLTNTTPEVVCRYLTSQWKKIGKSVCRIEPWDQTKTPLGVWYLTQNDPYPTKYSRYFHGENCHWKMSTLLHTKILWNANQKETI
jgi:hypothetical protein